MRVALLKPSRKLSRARYALSRIDEAVLIHKIAETSKVEMEYGTAKLVAEAAMLPMPTAHQWSSSNITRRGKVVHRKAKQTEEFLVRNQFVRCILPDGRVETRVVVHDPVHLKHQKSAHAIVEVLRRDWETGRQLGHVGCAVASYKFDRLVLTALERIWRKVHAADAPCHDGLSLGLPTDVFRLTQFVIVGGCAAHDVHNAFRWSLFFKFRDPGLLRCAYVTVESLHNSVSSI